VNAAGLVELLESTDAKSDSEVLDLLLDTQVLPEVRMRNGFADGHQGLE